MHPRCLFRIWWKPSALMTRNCSMSCSSWSNANAANSKAGKPRAVKTRPRSNADVCPARNRRLTQFLRSRLLFAIDTGGGRMALVEVVACARTEPGRFALRVAGSPLSDFRCHYVRVCRAVISVAGTPVDSRGHGHDAAHAGRLRSSADRLRLLPRDHRPDPDVSRGGSLAGRREPSEGGLRPADGHVPLQMRVSATHASGCP